MRSAKSIKFIAIHCSAGFGDRKSIEAFWKTKGWNSPGYHFLIEVEGKVHQLLQMDQISNGVLGFNGETINICYVGGVQKNDKGVLVAKDTRTTEQKCALQHCIGLAFNWIRENGGDVSKIKILGHRDFSPDKNGNGVIESWERIKECPSFDAIPEYKSLIPKS